MILPAVALLWVFTYEERDEKAESPYLHSSCLRGGRHVFLAPFGTRITPFGLAIPWSMGRLSPMRMGSTTFVVCATARASGVQQSQQSGLVRRRVFDGLVTWQSGCMSLRSNIFLDLFPSSVTFAKFIPCISDPAPNGCPPPVAGGLRSGPRCGTNSDPTGAERVVFRGSSC